MTVQQLAATKAPVRAATGVRVLPVSLPATTHIMYFYYKQRDRKVGLSLTQISRYSRVLSLVLNELRLLATIHIQLYENKQTHCHLQKEQTHTHKNIRFCLFWTKSPFGELSAYSIYLDCIREKMYD